MAGISKFFRELRRRNVFRVAALYIVAAWVLLQVTGLALESWGLPSSALRYIWIGALIGFPLAIIFGWAYDISDGGIVRTPTAQAGDKVDLSLGRSDYLLLGAMTIILVAVVYGTINQIQLTGSISTKEHVRVSVSTWPEADMMFRRDPYWLGGDASASIDLGGGRILWLFGDSFVALVPGQSRAESTFVKNSVAIQRGYDPSSAVMRFYWHTDGPRPTSFFKDNRDRWYWPTSAVLIDRFLLIFLVETKATDHGLGFEHTSMAAVVVENPQDAPDFWRLHEIPVPPNESGIFIGYSDMIRVEDHVYAFSKQELTNDVYLVRWSLKELFTGSLESAEWWSGDTDKWLPAEASGGKARPVFSDTPTSFSIHYHQRLKEFVQLQTWGFGGAVVAMRTAAKLTGPWSDRQIIYRPDESHRSDAMVYGGKGHIHLIGADIVATYNANSAVFSNLLTDQSIYYPRFIRIDIEP